MSGKFFFIMGLGRSGTSLLQSVVNGSFLVQSYPETHFLRLYAFNPWQNICRIINRSALSSSISRNKYLARLKQPDNVKLLCRPGQSLACNYFYFIQSIFPDHQYFLDKDPLLLLHVNNIFSTCPDARLLYTVRDPRAIIASRIKSSWSAKRSWLISLLVLYYQNLVFKFSLLAAKSSSSILTVKYENLVSDFDSEIRRIFDHLDIPINSFSSDYYSDASSLISSAELQWKSNILQPVFTDSVSAWSSMLSSFQIKIIESFMFSYFVENSYSFEYSTSSLLSRLFRLAIHLLLFPIRIGAFVFVLSQLLLIRFGLY